MAYLSFVQKGTSRSQVQATRLAYQRHRVLVSLLSISVKHVHDFQRLTCDSLEDL